LAQEISVRFESQGEREIVASRTLTVPPGSVFAALTTPDLLRQWLLGPPGWDMPICEVDLRVGGRYRYGWSNGGTKRLTVGGEFLEIEAPVRFVATERFEGPWDQGETIITYALAASSAGTRMTVTMQYGSETLRDAMAASDMERGLASSFDRLAALLAAG
jgi:uncharacterized protein YndB with AHSA1/START domain